jgi:hypothetical protein
MQVIYLTKEQADKVRGKHGLFSILEPLITTDGNYILPKEVLNDKEHFEIFSELFKCKIGEIDIKQITGKNDEVEQILSIKTISKETISEAAPREWKILNNPLISLK